MRKVNWGDVKSEGPCAPGLCSRVPALRAAGSIAACQAIQSPLRLAAWNAVIVYFTWYRHQDFEHHDTRKASVELSFVFSVSSASSLGGSQSSGSKGGSGP